jgi:MarR family transcriptional regulator for hemolysin
MPIADDPDAQTRLRQAYTHALQTGARTWRRAANAVAEVHGLSDATAYPLVMIGRLAGEPRQNALAEAVGIEGPSLVRLLDQLTAAGLVVRRSEEPPPPRPAKVIALTPSGRAMVARIEAELATLRARLFAEISAADLEASLRVFAALQAQTRDPGETTQESAA